MDKRSIQVKDPSRFSCEWSWVSVLGITSEGEATSPISYNGLGRISHRLNSSNVFAALWLKQALAMEWKRMLHHLTYRRVQHAAIDLVELEDEAWRSLKDLNQESAELQNLDGKSLRGTIRNREAQGLHLLAVQQTKESPVVSQTAVRKRENEISAAKRMLKKK